VIEKNMERRRRADQKSAPAARRSQKSATVAAAAAARCDRRSYWALESEHSPKKSEELGYTRPVCRKKHNEFSNVVIYNIINLYLNLVLIVTITETT